MSNQCKIKGLDRPELKSSEVFAALAKVPREKFIPNRQRSKAFEDSALPIGMGQTISQPFIVGLMSQEADIRPGDRVLEIGTGSGYQSAILAELGAEVFSIEIVPELALRAEQSLRAAGYTSIHLRRGDGWDGWPEEAPFDAILITASSPRRPDKLLGQLRDGGRLIVPLESDGDDHEELMVYERCGGSFIKSSLGGVRFVDLTGKVRESPGDLPPENSEKRRVTVPVPSGKTEE